MTDYSGVAKAKVIKRYTPVELIHAIYVAEGWKLVEGENRTARCNGLYTITADHKTNRYVAIRKE